jgi:hypothetical protein
MQHTAWALKAAATFGQMQWFCDARDREVVDAGAGTPARNPGIQ